MKKTEYIAPVRQTWKETICKRVWQGDNGHYYVKENGGWCDITGTKSEQMMSISDKVR